MKPETIEIATEALCGAIFLLILIEIFIVGQISWAQIAVCGICSAVFIFILLRIQNKKEELLKRSKAK